MERLGDWVMGRLGEEKRWGDWVMERLGDLGTKE